MAAPTGAQILAAAEQYIGTPYTWGGESPGGFDCSGLVQYVFGQFGIRLPRVTYDQVKALRNVPITNVQVGDLIFFDSPFDGVNGHVGIYAGNGMVLDAPHTGAFVRVEPLSGMGTVSYVGRAVGVIPGDGGTAQGTSLLGNTALGSGTASSVGFQMPNLITVSPFLNPQELASNYGLTASFLQSIPELDGVFQQAVAQSWTQAQFQAAVQGTQWWQTNSATMRQFQDMRTTNPAQFNQAVQQKAADIQKLATELGVPLAGADLTIVAENALMFGQDDSQVQQELKTYVAASKEGHFGGYAGQVELSLRQYAQQMGVEVTDQYLQNATTQIVGEGSTLAQERGTITAQAQNLFPAYAQQIQAGQTVQQIAAPYANSMANLWEMDPSAINPLNPTLRKALTYTDPRTGKPATLPEWQFQTQLRQDPTWLKTRNARDSFTGAAMKILSDMGLASADIGSAANLVTDPQTQLPNAGALNPTSASTGPAFAAAGGPSDLANISSGGLKTVGAGANVSFADTSDPVNADTTTNQLASSALNSSAVSSG